jgi:histidinol-phosphatase
MLTTCDAVKLTVEVKSDQSLVTSLDQEIETRLREQISLTFPEHGIIGEEYADHLPESDLTWVLDPVDGTQEFINQLPFYGTMIALLWHGKPVVGVIDHPPLDICCYAGLGLGAFVNEVKIQSLGEETRTQAVVLPARAEFEKNTWEDDLFQQLTSHYSNYRVFRSCYGHTTTLLGQTCLTFEHKIQLWDFAASQILIEEAGGKFTVIHETTMAGEKCFSLVFGSKPEVDKALIYLQPLLDRGGYEPAAS